MVEYKGTQSINELRNKIKNLMQIDIKNLIDMQLTVMTKRIFVDIFKIDDILHKRFGEYENDNKSMSDIILEKYGEESHKLIKQLL